MQIVAKAKTTARDKRVAFKIANTTYIPYTMKPKTNLAELDILKPGETKSTRPADFNLLTNHDDGYRMLVHSSKSKILTKLRKSLVPNT